MARRGPNHIARIDYGNIEEGVVGVVVAVGQPFEKKHHNLMSLFYQFEGSMNILENF